MARSFTDTDRRWLAGHYEATEIDAARYYHEMAFKSSRIVEHSNSYSNGVNVEVSVLDDGRKFVRHAGLFGTLYFEGLQVDTDAVVTSVWQTFTDEGLQALTPQTFYGAIADLGLADEDAEEAWGLFADRRLQVFGGEG